jgi:hypothetical protein
MSVRPNPSVKRDTCMNLKDPTKNQHFVPQIEQRLNAANPCARDENQKIYAFNLVDRENHKIKLRNSGGIKITKSQNHKITKSLSLNDLFSFDILEKDPQRYNFESLFQKYESSIKDNTLSLLEKLSTNGTDITPEILNIFISKFINFVRNPYSIKKVLNSFPALTKVHPTDPFLYENFERILRGRKPHQKYLCEELEISEKEYAEWLSVIFLLLAPFDKEKPNLLEQIIKSIYESRESFIMIMIYTYDEKTCLLSDRGYSIPLPEHDHMAFDFNLCSSAFIRYVFGNIDAIAPKIASKERIELFKSMPKIINAQQFSNDLNALEQYNRHVVYQCFETVFNSSTECYGL